MQTKTVNLGELGIGFRELGELAEMLTELADKGELYRQKFDLDSLKIGYNPYLPEIFLFDDEGNTTLEREEDE